MKKSIISLLIFALFLVSCQKQKDAQAIRTTFESYKTAIKNHSDSITYYLDSESIEALTTFEKIVKTGEYYQIDGFIRKYDAPLTWNYLFSTLEKLDSNVYDPQKPNIDFTMTLFSLAGLPIFDSKMIDDFRFGEITKLYEEMSTVKLIVSNHFYEAGTKRKIDVKKEFYFRKENNEWKINVISYFKLFDKVIEYKASEMRLTPENYIKQTISKLN